MRMILVRSAACTAMMLGLLWIPAAEASLEGAAACLECHESAQTSHKHGNHAGVMCDSCHGGTAEHLGNPGETTAPTKPDAANCQGCHAKNAKLMNWKFSDHAVAAVNCSDCHGIHQPKASNNPLFANTLKDKNTELCVTCHQGTLASFSLPSHHPVKEGAMSCTSCHDPHGGNRTSLTSKTAQCTQCHQSVRGPHVHEHPPAAEDCASCHNPHGSPNRRLLQIAEPMLCLQCHSLAGNRHGQTGANNNTQRITGAALQKCSSCHSQVHGSSHDQNLRY